MKLETLFNTVKIFTVQHESEILTAIGIAGMATSLFFAIKASPKAEKVMNEIVDKHKNDEKKTELIKETVTKVAPIYIPTAVTFGVSAMCIIGGLKVNLRRNAALATAYAITENSFKEYQEKTKAIIGEKKEQTIRDEVARDQMSKHPVTSSQVFVSDDSTVLCFDDYSKRYFTCSIDKLEKLANTINKNILCDAFCGTANMNDYYFGVGLEPVDYGELKGFNLDNLLTFDYSAMISDDGRPCIVVRTNAMSSYDS